MEDHLFVDVTLPEINIRIRMEAILFGNAIPHLDYFTNSTLKKKKKHRNGLTLIWHATI